MEPISWFILALSSTVALSNEVSILSSSYYYVCPYCFSTVCRLLAKKKYSVGFSLVSLPSVL